jgi:alkylated DNA repair dioxygenase AlkB
LDKSAADKYLASFLQLQQDFKDEKSFYGNPPARQVMWFGDFKYTYSKVSSHEPRTIPDWLQAVASQVEKTTNECMQRFSKETSSDNKKVESPKFRGILNNLYRNGKDSISWHSDNEDVLAPGVPISSLSVGAERVFELRRKRLEEGNKKGKKKKPEPHIYFKLSHGALFVMGGNCQKTFEHSVPKDESITGPRVNSTFRQYKTGA